MSAADGTLRFTLSVVLFFSLCFLRSFADTSPRTEDKRPSMLLKHKEGYSYLSCTAVFKLGYPYRFLCRTLASPRPRRMIRTAHRGLAVASRARRGCTRALTAAPPAQANKAAPVIVKVSVPASGDQLSFTGYEGESLQSIAEREPDLQYHLACTCGGNAACSTCHVYVDSTFYDKVPAPEEEEVDMLDMAWGFEDGKSRLGCCLRLTKEMDGFEVEIPEGSNNLF